MEKCNNEEIKIGKFHFNQEEKELLDNFLKEKEKQLSKRVFEDLLVCGKSSIHSDLYKELLCKK